MMGFIGRRHRLEFGTSVERSSCAKSNPITLLSYPRHPRYQRSFSLGQKHGRGPPRRARGKLSKRITRIMYIGFVAWEHAPRSGVPRLLERLRHEQRHSPPLVSAPSALSAVFFVGPKHGQRPPRRARGKLSERITRIMYIGFIA